METELIIVLICICALTLALSFFSWLRLRQQSENQGAGTNAATDSLKENIASMLRVSEQADFNNMDRLIAMLAQRFTALEARMSEITRHNEMQMSALRETLEGSLRYLKQSTAEDLKEMRLIVDEKLSRTLDSRLNKSFEIINSRLEAVYKGLGEMQGLAQGVGDLKRVLTNVKLRGTLGEMQLEMLLQQVLTPQQYRRNVSVDGVSQERVDFAVIMPGRHGESVYLPVDAKFPMEHYLRLQQAADSADAELADKHRKAMYSRVLDEGKKISEKYIAPPYTTDFAIMYLPVEGLYAEVLKSADTVELLQRRYKVITCGPTTLGALLSSLQMGFKTLAIQKRSSEIWQLLSVFKTEFGKFTDIIARTQKKLTEVTDTVDDAARKTRTIERKLKNVSSLDQTTTDTLDSENTDAIDSGNLGEAQQ